MVKMTKLKEKLTELRVEGEEGRAKLLAEKLGLPFLDLKIIPIQPKALALVPEEESQKAKLAVIQKKAKKIVVAACNPNNPDTKNILDELKKKYEIQLFISSLHGLKKAWKVYKRVPKKPKEDITGQVEIGKELMDKLRKEIKNIDDIKKRVEKTKQTTAIVEILLAGSLPTNSSDIHLETTKENVNVRYRIDGMLQDVVFLSLKSYNYILNRLKLLSGLKLNIRDKAQDGRFTIVVNDADVEVRVSCIPSAYGENIVMRVLNPKAINLELKDLGLREEHLKIIQKEIKKPKGMIITTGPTGSGKTTLLYSLIKTINKPEVKIITLEDPIEYHLKGITQTQVDIERDYTFANGLRSILRQDPDIVLIGEIRDKETAEIAIQASLTGHLVLSTLHANDAAGAVPRFLDIGINPSSMGSALNIIIAQRLIRKLCPKCKKAVPFPEEIKKTLKNVEYPSKIYEAKGCKECSSGYKGRIGIFEMISINDEMEKLINTTPSHIEIVEKTKGIMTFYQDGLLKVLEGITSLKEIERVAGE